MSENAKTTKDGEVLTKAARMKKRLRAAAWAAVLINAGMPVEFHNRPVSAWILVLMLVITVPLVFANLWLFFASSKHSPTEK